MLDNSPLLTVMMMTLSQEWVDLPSYIKRDYKIAKGQPSSFQYHSPKTGPRYWEVVIQDRIFKLPENLKEEDLKKTIKIIYLSHSKFVINFTVNGN